MYKFPEINGIKQYIQIRGKDRSNPLLLVVHGGPGGSLSGLCHVMQSVWEEHFTVVNWDQRNTCKTYSANRYIADEVAKTGTLSDYITDINGIIAYLHKVCDFDKIIIMGFSWGSVIGAEYTKIPPEDVLCYVGVGQYVNHCEGTRLICKQLKELASQSGNTEDVDKVISFEKLAENATCIDKKYMTELQKYATLTAKYIIKHAKMFPLKELFNSPFLNLKEKFLMLKTEPELFSESYKTMLSYDFHKNMHFDVPVLFVYGDEDCSCPASLLIDCYEKIEAPYKEYGIIQNAGHTCFYDNPDEFDRILIDFTNKYR